MIRAKANRILAEVNALMPPSPDVDQNYSAGWFWDFWHRWNFRFVNCTLKIQTTTQI